MAGESISIPILTPGADAAARNIKQVGNAAAETAGKLDIAAASLALWDTTAAKSAKADQTLVASKRAHAKADALLADAENVLAGKATTTTRLFADQGRQQDSTAKSAAGLASRFSSLAGTGGIPGGGMGALIGAGVALSPVIATVGTGLLGFGAAAYGVAKPIENAAAKTGGLAANMKLLNPEQQQVARGLLGLGAEFAAFQKQMAPEVFGVFNQGIRLAGHLLHDVEPVAAATGKALGGVLASVDKEFASGTWQQFFAFMARTAGPDVQLLGKDFTDLLQVLPPLLQDLQPLGRAILVVSDDAIKAAGGVTSFYNAFQRDVPISTQHTANAVKDIDHWVVDLTNHIPGAKAVNDWITSLQHGLSGTGAASGPASQGLTAVGGVAVSAQARLLALNKAADALSASWVSAPAKAAPATDAITRMAAAEQAAFLKAGPATDQITRLGTSAAIGAGRVKPLTDQITMTAHANEAAARSAGPLTDVISRMVIPAKAAAVQFADIAKAVTAINTAESKALSVQTAYAGDLVTTAGDAAALEKALDGTHGKIGLNTAAQRNSFAAANTYITDLGNTASAAYTSGKGVDASIAAIRRGLPLLDSAKTKNRAYWQEVQTLVGWLDKLRLEKAIHENVFVSGSGVFTVRAGSKLGLPGGTAGGPFGARGAYVTQGTTPTADNVLARVSKGELIVPASMVNSGAVDHLRGQIPGFAAGGLAGSYRGNVAGLVPWSKGDLNATVRIFEQATAAATLAAMKAAARAAASAGAPGSQGGPTSASAAQAQAYARSRLGAYGWGADQMGPLIALWNQESGWNRFARNPTSGAYGIPQALPPGKMGAAANPPLSSAAAQINWGLGYIRSVYNSPANAEFHEQRFHWYDRGGLLPPGLSLAYNGTGRPEMVLPNRGGGAQRIVLEVRGGPAEFDQFMLKWIQKNARIRGGGDVQKAFGKP